MRGYRLGAAQSNFLDALGSLLGTSRRRRTAADRPRRPREPSASPPVPTWRSRGTRPTSTPACSPIPHRRLRRAPNPHIAFASGRMVKIVRYQRDGARATGNGCSRGCARRLGIVSTAMRIGVVFPTKEFVPVEQMVERFAELERNGFSSGWLPQSLGFDALTLLAVAGGRVPRLELGTSVIPAFPRHPIVLGAQALTTNAVIGGRLLLRDRAVGQDVDRRVLRPFLRPAHASHRRLPLGPRAPLAREHRRRHDRDDPRPHPARCPGATPPPVLLAALQPRMHALAGGVADGTITWCTGPVTVEEQIVPLITAAAREAGKPAQRASASRCRRS